MMTAAADMLKGAFISPLFLWFLGLIPVVILLYLLKLRRTQVVISSTMLWLKSLQDLTANAPFQRLRKNLLLLLQILILIALAIALGRPFVRAEQSPGQNLCLLMDRSASMQTKEAADTRMDKAKEKAITIINEMKRGDKAMLVTFAENSEVLCELTEDRVRLRHAVGSIVASDAGTRMRDAFAVARSLKSSDVEMSLSIVVISDGQIVDLAEVAPKTRDGVTTRDNGDSNERMAGLDMTFLQVGKNRENAGIVAFSMRTPMDETQERQTFALVHNGAEEALSTTLTMHFNDEMVAVSDIEIEAGGDQEVVFSHADLGEGVMRAELDVEDALSIDNVAWLAMRPATQLQVLLVAETDSPSAFFLQRVLALDPRVLLQTVAPGDYLDGAGCDLVVFEGYAPPALPQGSLLFINAIPPIEGLVATGEIENPPVIAADGDHPAMRFLNPSNVGVRKAQRLSLPEGSRALVSTTGGPLVADVSRGGQQILLVAFSLLDSDWPLNLSFPLFIQNVLSWAPRAAAAGELTAAAGNPLTIMPEPGVESANVKLPDGTVEDVLLDPLRPVYFANTNRVGLYEVTRGTDAAIYAVNLLNRTETIVEPAQSLSVGRAEFTAEKGKLKVTRELWRWFVVAGILILAFEWWVYSRRAWL